MKTVDEIREKINALKHDFRDLCLDDSYDPMLFNQMVGAINFLEWALQEAAK